MEMSLTLDIGKKVLTLKESPTEDNCVSCIFGEDLEDTCPVITLAGEKGILLCDALGKNVFHFEN